MIDSTNRAYSSGLPKRDGFGICFSKKCFTFDGKVDNKGVSNNPETNIYKNDKKRIYNQYCNS